MWLNYLLLLFLSINLIATYNIPDKGIKLQEWFAENTNLRSSDIESKEISNRNLSGSFVATGRFSYVVALEVNGSLCAGAVINSTFILTSAHCVAGGIGSDILAFVGSAYFPIKNVNLEQLGSVVNVKYVYQHEDYILKDKESSNDIALLELTNPLTLNKGSNISSIPIKQKSSPQNCTFLGWEFQYNGIAMYSSYLQYLNDTITKRNSASGKLCVGPREKTVDILLGDPGGPLVCDEQLVGILSSNSGCNSSFYSQTYTDVSYYYEWITNGHPTANHRDNGASSMYYNNIPIGLLVYTVYSFSTMM